MNKIKRQVAGWQGAGVEQAASLFGGAGVEQAASLFGGAGGDGCEGRGAGGGKSEGGGTLLIRQVGTFKKQVTKSSWDV